MFIAEAKGLSILRSAKALAVPEVIHTGLAGPFQFLLLQFIEEAARGGDYWRDFGSGLAALHKNSAREFGLDHDNFIGSLPQKNKQGSSWAQFFIEQRLKVQLKISRDQGRIDNALSKKLDATFIRIPEWLPEEPPSLLHGDLWSGNLMTTSRGGPCLIDPAVYYGNREADLAMTQLFGGFDPSYFESYNEMYPLASGYRERLDLYNLYPLLVHVNLFGGGYKSQVEKVVNRFI